MREILEKRVVPVAVVPTAEAGVALTGALREAGLNVVEITLRTDAALPAIAAIRRAFPDMLIGAGTILAGDQVDAAADAGADFGVAPGLNEDVVSRAGARSMPFVPGVMTPTEVERALALGCRMLKFFPAEPAGGVKLLSALAGPYAHTGVRFIPLGGVNATNAAAYLALPVVAAIGGSWIADRKLVAAGRWDEITRLTREALDLCRAPQGGG